MIPEKVQTVLDRYGLTALEFEAGSTPTSAKAARMIGVSVGQIAKSMLLKARDSRYFLVVCAGDARLSNKKLKSLVGAKARLADPQETERITGFSPGGVCPFGLQDLPVYIDEGLSRYDVVYPAAGTDGSGVPLTFEQLCEISGGARCDVCD